MTSKKKEELAITNISKKRCAQVPLFHTLSIITEKKNDFYTHRKNKERMRFHENFIIVLESLFPS
jgi:hypothetical protein